MRFFLLVFVKPYRLIWVSIFMLLHFITIQVKGQSALIIKYDWTSLNFKAVNSFSVYSWQTPIDLRMAVNDSFALVYVDHSNFNIENIRRRVDGELIHGANFYDFTKNERFYEINSGKDFKYLIQDSIVSWNWQFMNAEKKILNKTCHPALSVNKNNDSVLVWYTKEFAFQKGPVWYDSIPGVILEVFDQRRNAHIKAFKMREKNIDIIYPAEGTKVSLLEWKKIAKEFHDKKYELHSKHL